MKEAELNFKATLKAKERITIRNLRAIASETKKTIRRAERNIKNAVKRGQFGTCVRVTPLTAGAKVKEYLFKKGYITREGAPSINEKDWFLDISWGVGGNND